jgi:hypothetical protein
MEFKQYGTAVHFGVGVGSNVVLSALDSIMVDREDLGGGLGDGGAERRGGVWTRRRHQWSKG